MSEHRAVPGADPQARTVRAPDTTAPPDPAARSDRLSGLAFWVAVLLAAAGLAGQPDLQPWHRRVSADQHRVLYLVIGLFGAFAFLAFPARRSQRGHIPWFDWLLAAGMLALGLWLDSEALTIQLRGWQAMAPPC
jgi:TRAP-type uncharacterized transport system fused permease subunit